MATIADLRKDILSMSPEEMMEKIREIRRDRITRKEQPVAKATKKRTVDKAATSIAALLGGLDADAKAALMKELGL